MSTQLENEQQVTHGGKGDPVYTWLLHSLPLPKHETTLPKILRAFFTQGALNGGIFIEADNFGCCGLFMPPGTNIENPWTLLSAGLFSTLWTIGLGGFKRAMFDYPGGVEPLMKKAFAKAEQKEHWYVFIMGTANDRRRLGHAAKLLLHLQDQARKDGRPIWLEATTDASRELYLKQGFEIVGEVILGKGSVGPDGLPAMDGQGIKIWSMLWRP